MTPTRDTGNEIETIEYRDYVIVVIEYSDDDYPADKTYCFDIYAEDELLYEGDRDYDFLFDSVDSAKKIIDDYETVKEPTVTDWYDYYGVNRRDFLCDLQ